MSETDWREILSFSQKELIQADKEKLCESLSWMEADDIELNFSDLKTLFRLAQDILKYRSEQVNNLHGQLETVQRKSGKSKTKGSYAESPSKGSDSVFETIAHQEEVIKANKEILEQLYADIAELEAKKSNVDEDKDKDSDSSRDVLSEINEVAQLENEVVKKNRHIRKLLSDVNVLEEENSKLKEKLSVFKNKLTEATNLIENLTEQLFTINNECTLLKEMLGKTEESKSQLSIEIESLRKELFDKEAHKDSLFNEIKAKVQHWKNIARSKKSEVEALANENAQLKENLSHTVQPTLPPKSRQRDAEDRKNKELQTKLSEASKQIEQSADIIEELKEENNRLKALAEDPVEVPISETKNESDDSKERICIYKLKKKVNLLNVALKEAEDMIVVRDKELADITAELQLVQSDEGIKKLLDGLKSKKRQLKFKDEGIKSLVLEVNTLNQLVDELQLENETLRQKLNVPRGDKIPTKGILKKLYETEEKYSKASKHLKKVENKLTQEELDNRVLKSKCNKMLDLLSELGCAKDRIDQIIKESDADVENDGISGQTSSQNSQTTQDKPVRCNCEVEMQSIADENEGLRKGLQEILNFLKDNSTTCSGVLSLECPSLDAILQSMEARHAAGWFAPHMATVMELRAALGGRDALLTALHEARKETFDVMTKLSKETQKSKVLELKLEEIESKQETKTIDNESEIQKVEVSPKITIGEFGSWMSFEEDERIDFNNTTLLGSHIAKRNTSYEDYLKRGLSYFHEKFKTLFKKMTSIVVETADQQNQWSIQEEQYKAQIENLKAQLSQQEEMSVSEISPGLVPIQSSSSLERKCSFLEESYRYMRTTNENMKNEMLESKKESMLLRLEYDTQIQSLMLIIANLFDKLRNSISIDLFWNQNAALNQAIGNYRKLLEDSLKQEENINLLSALENLKIDILNDLRRNFQYSEAKGDDQNVKSILNGAEQSVMKRQLEEVCVELEKKDKQIKLLQSKNIELQETQAKLIYNNMVTTTKDEIDLTKSQLNKLAEENKLLKEQCQHIESQLDIALLQLQDRQQRQMSNDMEINMLRHQILDLQAVGDNKAIMARLSGEVLIAHLQASESHKKIERLNTSLNREKQSRVEAEEMLKARQKVFDIYAMRYESKFRYMNDVMQVLRQQYHGSLPIASIENYLNKVEDLKRKTRAANEKLQDIEDLQFSLMTKHSVFEQVLDLSKNKCIEEEDGCPHKLKNMVMEGIHSREEKQYHIKLKNLEQSREELLKYCNELENTLVLVNQGFEKANIATKKINGKDNPNLQLEDIQSDDESNTRKSETVTLDKPQVLKPMHPPDRKLDDKENKSDLKTAKSNHVHEPVHKVEKMNVAVQTDSSIIKKQVKFVQTDADLENSALKNKIVTLKTENDRIKKELNDSMELANRHMDDVSKIHSKQINMRTKIESLIQSNQQKDAANERLRTTIEELRRQNDDIRSIQTAQRNKLRDAVNEENKSLLLAIKQLESDRNNTVLEYQELLQSERKEYSKSIKELNSKIVELKRNLDSKESDSTTSNAEAVKEAVNKYTRKIAGLEDTCFKAQSDLESCRTELITYQSELDRWKELAIERLAKMEQLNLQLEERHSHEVESYKAENQHWLSQLNETQREHLELRSRLTEQKTLYVKQLSDKDSIIEQLRSAVHNLKTQILSMQTMISVNDPSFDLSAIVEVEESSDISHHGSERLELKFDSTIDLRDMDDALRMPATSTAIWQEPVIERLRREKQFATKQNAILRRQIKALAARERRARLDAQNLKNQVFRISTSGTKVVTAESAALQSKIASLQAQLTSARRDSSSSIALWDKWKRAQQTSERWQARYEEKCQEVKKLEGSLSLAKSAVTRLEKEKRLLLSRLTEVKHEKQLTIEKQDSEVLEKSYRPSERDSMSPPPVSARALLDRVQAQQRRIAALEVAEKGNEVLVSEYERALAEITSLKGQVLKLESTLLESQIRIPLQHATQDAQPEVDYWKSYCEMLKEENVQLNMRVNAMETAPTTANQHRVNDLEQTVLTLRGLVSKLQAEQRSSIGQKRVDSRPNSGRSNASITDKGRKQVESHRIEIANLKRSLQDKDLLLEKSKEMLKIAAEREDELLRENAFLRRRLDELTTHKGGFLSA